MFASLAALVPAVYVPGPIDTAVTAQFDQVTGFVTTVVVGALFGLVGLGIAIALGIKYSRRGAKNV